VPRKRRTMGGVDRLPSGRYRVRVVDPGSGRRLSVGTFATKIEAARAYAEVVTDQDRGAWVTPDDGRVTLAEFRSLGSPPDSRPAVNRSGLGSANSTNASSASISSPPSDQSPSAG
jgi:hypothetical protein